MTGYEQLALDLDVPARKVQRHRRGDRALSAGRVLLSVLAAIMLAGAAIGAVPYRSSIAGVDIVVSGSVTPAHRGLSVDSSLGDLRFRNVTGLPVGLHVTPEISLAAVRAVSAGGDAFATHARADLEAQVPRLVMHFALDALLGLVLGALLGGLLFDGAVQLFGSEAMRTPRPHRRQWLETGVRVTSVCLVLSLVTATFTAITYNSTWYARYSVTGLLADVAATPSQLAALDARDSGAADKIRAVLRLKDVLTQPLDQRIAPDTAYSILFISDVHRRNIYPYLQQYITTNDVTLIVNTGDETLVGNSAELTPDYTDAIAAITATTPMIWVKGNHDSAAVAARMASIPGVTVLDGQVLRAFGLQIYGTADPRTYGAAGDLGSDRPEVVTKVETEAAKAALHQLDRSTYLDLLLAHEPVEANALTDTLGASVRAQASGHLHHQNADGDLQNSERIRLIEGTTGMGGLLADSGDPMEFSIMSVATDCQFTRIVRYQLADPALPVESRNSSFGQNSSFVVHYFDRQPIATGRVCSTSLQLSKPELASSNTLETVTQWGSGGAKATPTGTAVSSPAPVASSDETGDAAVPTSTTSP